MDEMDDLDELELFDQHDLEDESSVGSRSGSDAGSDDEEDAHTISEEQYYQLKCTVVDIITAMGGLEEELGEDGNVKMVYVVGDECLLCLRQLRNLWRQDEENPNRVIPRIFAEVNVLQTGLLPLLLKTAGKDEKAHRVAMACTDLMTSITWPIDIEAEQQAILRRGDDDDGSATAALQVLERAQISYKSAVLRARSRETNGSQRCVLDLIMLHILLPSLSKPRHQRTERDVGIIHMCMHLFRNLLAISDPVATSLSSMDVIAESRVQSDLVVELNKTRILDTILMLSNNADSKDYNAWNIITSECVFYIFAGSSPEELVIAKEKEMSRNWSKEASTSEQNTASSKKPQTELARLLAAESREEIESQKLNGSTRHSRFNTMVNYIDKHGNKKMATGQAALRKSAKQLASEAEARSKRKIHRRKGLEERGARSRQASWTPQASKVLSAWADRFMKLGYEILTRSVLEDIRRERPKVGDLDQARTRIMQMGCFFLEYFLSRRQASQSKQQALGEIDKEREKIATKEDIPEEWPFSLVAQWLEPWALRMAYVRSGSSFEKKHWLEYVAAINLWTTLFKLIDALSKSASQEDRDVAEGILATHFYDQAAIDSAKTVLSSYTTQSFSCLRAIIALGQIMPRMLERYSKDKDHMYVKAKQQVRKSTKSNDKSSLAEEEIEVQTIAKNQQTERKFEFEKFQSKMCSNHLADACLLYLSRWQEFQDHASEQVYNVTQILHRLAVKASDLGLFFPYKRRMILQSLQSDYSFWSFVRTDASQVESDLRKLFQYILRKFDKLSEEEQAKWGDGMALPKAVKIFKMPAEIEIKPSRGHLDDVGIAVGLMLEKDKLSAVMWIKSGLEEAIRMKKAIVEKENEEGDVIDDDDDDVDEDRIPNSALSKFTDFDFDYGGNDLLTAEASTLPEFKLLCRLLGLKSDENDTHRWIWTVPADALPHELEKEVELIEDFIRRPLETFGETYSSMVSKVRKVPIRTARKIINEHGEEEEIQIHKVKGRRYEKKPTWVDNDFIEDSDEELELVARLIEEQKRQQEGRTPSPTSSSRQGRHSSATGSTSPPSSDHHAGSPRKNTVRKSKALFFDSDEEEEEEEKVNVRVEQIQDRVDTQQAQAKRILTLGDDEEGNASDENQMTMPARKKRALIQDDDLEDD